jgi:poly(hydroxyalkanoate) depolymerase family esterase
MSRWHHWLAKLSTNTQHQSRPADHIKAAAGAVNKALSAAGLLKTAENPNHADRPSHRTAHTNFKNNGNQFFWDRSGSAARTLDYKVYLPRGVGVSGTSQLALVIMLHGCTQDPDDFAMGTQMDALADQHGFIVAYPQQPSSANTSKCWNWFRPEDQHRDKGEPLLIAQMVRDLIQRYSLDRDRIYVAGMSAGGAMAVILARTYPDVFAAAAVHSGLAYGCANNVVSALAVMKKATVVPPARDSFSTPIIVFHGDHDATVDHSNADALARQVLADWPRAQPLSIQSSSRFSEGGRLCDRVIYTTPQGEIALDYWTIQGGGHLWAGGDPLGSHTDRTGPNASAHFWRFFDGHRHRH